MGTIALVSRCPLYSTDARVRFVFIYTYNSAVESVKTFTLKILKHLENTLKISFEV